MPKAGYTGKGVTTPDQVAHYNDPTGQWLKYGDPFQVLWMGLEAITKGAINKPGEEFGNWMNNGPWRRFKDAEWRGAMRMETGNHGYGYIRNLIGYDDDDKYKYEPFHGYVWTWEEVSNAFEKWFEQKQFPLKLGFLYKGSDQDYIDVGKGLCYDYVIDG